MKESCQRCGSSQHAACNKPAERAPAPPAPIPTGPRPLFPWEK